MKYLLIGVCLTTTISYADFKPASEMQAIYEKTQEELNTARKILEDKTTKQVARLLAVKIEEASEDGESYVLASNGYHKKPCDGLASFGLEKLGYKLENPASKIFGIKYNGYDLKEVRYYYSDNESRGYDSAKCKISWSKK